MSQSIYKMYETRSLFKVSNLITIYDATFNHTYKVKGEVHNFWELVYIQEGNVGVTANTQVMELHENQIIFHKPGEFHNIWSAKGSSPRVFIMTFTLDAPLKELEDTICTLLSPETQLMKCLMEECKNMVTVTDPLNNALQLRCIDDIPSYALHQTLKNYLELLIIHVIRHKGSTPKDISYKIVPHHQYAKVISYIQGNLYNKIDIDMICFNCNMSASTLKNLFRKYSGMSTMEYVNHMKIQEAMKLLAHGMTHKEIADQLAFSSPYYFSTVFKRIMGYPPSQHKHYSNT